ncbi:MAG: WG repeat-containing protein [Candidatus Nomurabacteria bacterium]|nr:WG repeat-containing protein [Candidatus Nomurabacteria bacterium]
MKKFWGKVVGFFSNKRAFYGLISVSAVILVAAVVVLGVIRPFRIMVLGVNVNQQFDQNQPIPFVDGGLYGYIDTKGKVLISPRFERAEPFNGKYALATSGERDVVIDKKGEIKLDAARDTVFYDEVSRTWLVGSTLYNANLKRVSKNTMDVRKGSDGLYPFFESGKYGVINARGKKIFDCGGSPCEVEIREAVAELRDTYALVSIENGTQTIINAKNGKKIVEYGNGTTVVVMPNNIFAVHSVEDGRTATFYRYIEKNRIAVEAEDGVMFSLFDVKNKYFLMDFGETWADKKRSGRYALYKQSDGTFLATTARQALTVSELTIELARSSCGDNKYGINTGDTEVLKCEYDDVELLGAPLFMFLKKRVGQEIVVLKGNGKYTLYDIKKRKILMSTETPIQVASDSPFFASYDSGSGKVMVYNAITGATEQIPTHDATSWTQGANYFAVNSTGQIRYYNNRLEEIKTTSPR